MKRYVITTKCYDLTDFYVEDNGRNVTLYFMDYADHFGNTDGLIVLTTWACFDEMVEEYLEEGRSAKEIKEAIEDCVYGHLLELFSGKDVDETFKYAVKKYRKLLNERANAIDNKVNR